MDNTQQITEDITASNRILTVPNAISFIRMLLVPVFLVLLANDLKMQALCIFAISSITDFLDGQIARRFNCVSKLGQLLDPAVDTLLMISGVVGTWAYCGLPMWVMIIVFLREAFLLICGAWLLRVKHIRIPVIFPGKVATTLLFFGICLLFLTEAGIWFVYAGVALQIVVACIYVRNAVRALKEQG